MSDGVAGYGLIGTAFKDTQQNLLLTPNAAAKTRAIYGASVLSGLFGSELFALQRAEVSCDDEVYANFRGVEPTLLA